MSRVSIYENGWIKIVFDGKNKEYGAYQLRKQSDKTMIIAFFLGLLFVTVALLIGLFSRKNTAMTLPDTSDFIVKVSYYQPLKPKLPEKQIIPATKKSAKQTAEKQLVHPEIVKPEEATQTIARTKDNTTSPVTTETTTAIAATLQSAMGAPALPTAKGGTTINPMVILDKLPEFPGGIDKFYKYVGNNFNNPDMGEAKTLRVYVSFVVEKDGSMTDIQVKRDPGYGLGKEAIRVLKSLKIKWEPGMIAGEPVRTAYNLPITVQLQ